MARKGATRARKWLEPEAPPPTLGAEVCDWIENYLPHGRGDLVGKPLVLHEDLRRFIWECYELDPVTGARLWDEAVIAKPKGYAKSEVLSALCCVEGLGPVRFDGWDSAGDPVAAPVEYAIVEIYAHDLDQTGNTFDSVGIMLGAETCRPELAHDYGRIDIGRHEESSTRVVLPEHRGTIEPRTSRPKSKQGGLPTFVGTEEMHEWLLPGLHQLYTTKIKDLIKRPGAWGCHATNWFGEGEGSVLQLLWEDLEAGAPGLLWFGSPPPKGMLPDEGSIKGLPDEVLIAALRSVYGSAWPWQQAEKMLRHLRRKSTKEGDWRRFYLNQPFAADHTWVDADTWKARGTGRAEIARGEVVGLGFIGTDRCAALVACSLEGRLLQPVKIWEDYEPDRAEVDAAVAAAHERWRVARMLANPWGWQTEIGRWSGRYGVKVVLRFPVREDRRMREALDRWDSSPWRHTGDETLRRHVLACSTRTERVKTENGWQHVPVNLEPKEAHLWIIGAQAMLLAHEAACQALSAPLPPPKPKPSSGGPRQPAEPGAPTPARTGMGLRTSMRLNSRRL